MKPTPVEFSEWRPDVATLDTKFASEVENVFAGVNSYLPFPSLLAFTDASLSNAGNDANTKVLLPFTGADGPATAIVDTNTGGSAHTWTKFGDAQIDTGVEGPIPGITGSLLLDGTGDYITTPDHADFTLGSSDFTIDCFFYVTDVAGPIRYLAGQGDAAGTAASESFIIFRDAGDKMRGTVTIGTTQYNCNCDTRFTNAINPGWHHLAFVRNGFQMRVFIDGVRDSGTVAISGTINNSTNSLAVGARGEFPSNTWKGGVAQFRMSNKARWWDNFAPPRVPYINAGGRACGLYSARGSDGSWKVYAGTTTKLLTWALAGWIDVSRTVGGAYNVPPTEMWSFEQSGDNLVAVNINDAPQVAAITAGTAFAALGGSPPRAGHVRQMGDFLFLSRLDQAPGLTNRTIIWSAINDITGWIIGTNLCDMQEFPDGGPVQGVAGAEIGYVVQDRTIRTLQFLPGDTTFIFNFSRVLHDRGCISKYGFASIGNVLYFVAEDGFYSITGQQVTPIGADKVNEWFLAHSDETRRDVVHCIAGVNKPRIVWVHHATSASTMYDRQIIFDWSNGRWAKAGVSAQVWGLLASPGLDLDTTGTEYQDVLLDSEAMPLDSFAYKGGRPLIGAIDPDGKLSTLAGPNMPATLETAELHLMPGLRAFVNEVYPLDDAASDASGEIANGTRETLQSGAPFWSPPVPIEQAVGSAFIMTSARLHRFRRFIPYASTWTHAQGVAVNAQPDGEGVNL